MRLPQWRRRQRADLDEEIRSHLAMAVQDRVARGESPDHAARAARREFGNVDLVKETTRDMWGWMSLDRLWQDVRYALRVLRRSPGFTAVALLTLALGIGANTAIFSVINAVVLRPLPFPQPDRLVSVSEMDLRKVTGGGVADSVSYPNFFDWRDRNQVFERLAAFRQSRITLTGAGVPQEVASAVVSADFFDTLGVPPLMGRGFRREEEKTGSHLVVLGEQLWRSSFGADPAIVGRAITVNGRPFTVVGVMPRRFTFPVTFPATQMWITIAEDARTENPGDTPITAQRGATLLEVVGRLRAGVSIRQAQAAMDVIARALAREYPDEDGSRGAVRIVLLLEELVGDTSYQLLVLLVAVGCVLLIACANIANLLLARGVGRTREICVRAALGASGGRLVRQLLTESVVLSIAGAGLGVLLALASIGLLVRLSPVEVRGLDQVTIDGPVILFAAALTVLTALLFGLIPAVHAARPQVVIGLKEGARTTAGSGQHRWRGALIVAETAVGVVLLVGAGLMLRSFDRLLATSPGFSPANVATMRFRLPDTRYSYAKQVRFYEELFPALRGLPGIESAAAVVPLPLSGNHLSLSFEQQGRVIAQSELPSADLGIVSPGYFLTMGIPLVRGRDFTARDDSSAPRVIIVDESFVRRYFPHENPIGQRIRPGLSADEKEPPWREVVGVVGDVRQERLSIAARPTFYIPYPQGMIVSPHLVVHAAGGRAPSEVVETVRKAVAARDPELVVANVRTLDEYVDRSIAGARFNTLLLALFATLGLLLTAVGLYGVTASGVAERTHEIGVRIALGAGAGAVLASVLRRGLVLTAAGLTTGMMMAAMASRLLQATLYNVRPLDPVTYAGVGLVLIAVALFACWIPARRATRVDPIRALRSE